ncbi:MAG: hypothetical protein K4571_17540 [Deltaproteobacteria bacterium]
MISFRAIILFVLAGVMLATSAFCSEVRESDSQLWKVGQRQWTIQEENNYSRWIEANITEDFFIRHDMRVDCADVPYALRWIYARIHHLPAAARTADNRFIGHWSTDWRHIPTDEQWDKDRRFRTALLSMIYRTSTRTLPFDTYPVNIAADSVTAGTIFLIAGDHAGIVCQIVTDGSTTHPVQTLEANLPTRIQKMLLRNFPFTDPGRDHVSGFVRFRWPVRTGDVWGYLPAQEYPFYSREQYSPDFTRGYVDYFEAVEKRINPKVHDPNEKADKIISTLKRRLTERIPIVLEGHKKLHESPCAEGSRSWEIYSTSDRDEFISAMVEHLEDVIRKNHLDRQAILDKMARIHLQISPERSITVQYVFQNSKWLSSDPNASIEARWGVDKCGMIAVQLKDARESIAFIQKKYGRTDPRYAERSIWAQQKVVDEMTRENQENNCTSGYLTKLSAGK